MKQILPKKHLLFILILSILLGCGATKNVKSPPIEVISHTLAKGVHDYGANSYAYDKTDIFYTYDNEVYSYLNLRDMSGEHFIRWDWIKPNGDIYFSTGNKPIKTKQGFYKSDTVVWHKLFILGDKAMDYPGNWVVNIYLDDNILVTDQFELRYGVNIEKMPFRSQNPDKSKWGLVIGIEDYAMLPKALYAKKDAMLVSQYFTDILGVPKDNVIKLFDGEVTKSKIEGFLKSYLPLNTNKDSILYVFYAGHGLPGLKEGEAYLATHDCDVRFIEHSGYKLKDFYKSIDELDLKQAYVFIDSCFSGVSLRGKEMLLYGSRPALIKVEDIDIPSNKIVSLNSSKADQISNSYVEKEHGLFTYFLLRGMRGPADSNKDAEITLKELFGYVEKNVIDVSNRNGIPQVPILIYGDDLIKDIKIADVLR